MSKRNIFLAVAGGVIVLAGAVWFFFIRSDAPPPVSLEEAIETVTDDTTPDATVADDSATDGSVAVDEPDAPAPETSLDGEWTVSQDDSYAGYRIGEELASIGTVTAVGRTSDIDATLTFNGSTVTDLTVTVDLTTLESDSSRRDGALRTRGLETDSFPVATFALTEPVDLGTVPSEGETITATATGDLTLHGVTNGIAMDLEGSLVGGTMVVIGSTDVTLTDYAIEAPTGFSVLTIEEIGTIEVQLAFVKG